VLLESRKELILFGGEFATANQHYHHGDTWRYEVASNRWSAVDAKRGPSARSGHRASAWRSGLLLHGGFYQTLTADRWFGDAWFLDGRSRRWAELRFQPGAAAPAPRSGHGFVVVPGKDAAVLYGGYSEVSTVSKEAGAAKVGGGGGAKDAAFLSQRTRSVVHSDLWVLRLGPLADYLATGGGGARARRAAAAARAAPARAAQRACPFSPGSACALRAPAPPRARASPCSASGTA
jgi:hypothetical protein